MKMIETLYETEYSLPTINNLQSIRTIPQYNKFSSTLLGTLLCNQDEISHSKPYFVPKMTEREKYVASREEYFKNKKLSLDYLCQLGDALQEPNSKLYVPKRKELMKNFHIKFVTKKAPIRINRRVKRFSILQPEKNLVHETAGSIDKKPTKGEIAHRKTDIRALIPEFNPKNDEEEDEKYQPPLDFEMNKEESYDENRKIDEKEQKEILEKLRTKTNFSLLTETKIKTHYPPKFIEKVNLSDDFPIFEDIKKIAQKNLILKKYHNSKSKNSKIRLHRADMFVYNPRKWEKNIKKKEKESVDEIPNELNQEGNLRSKKLLEMKNKISLLKSVEANSKRLYKEAFPDDYKMPSIAWRGPIV